MVLLIVSGTGMLIALFLLNWKKDAQCVRPYESGIRILGTIGMIAGFFSSVVRAEHRTDILLYQLVAAVLICPQFLATHLVQYCRNRDDRSIAQAAVRDAVQFCAAMTVWLALMAYCYIAF